MATDNIVVAIKSRPLLEREVDGPQWIIQNESIYQADALMEAEAYIFDHIYNETCTNAAVYNEIVKPLVHSCLSGFNATIFAYGQTSSGKTHTIMGNKKDMGIVALAIDDIFKCVAVNSDRQYLIRCSFFELYNEKLYDLIHLPIRPIRIREDSQGNVTVNADEVVVKSCDELMAVMLRGGKNKRIASTKMNKNSSRSHTIFRIIIESKDVHSNNLSVQVSQLNLVDLAGSERLAQTESTGMRRKEGININKSLLALGKVIRQLCDNESYVNYRDSKLTRILKASLGGNAKCLVIAAITVAAVEETKSTLEFAQRAKKVKNKPTINEITSTESLKEVQLEYDNQLKRTRQKISELENELKFFKKRESGFQAVMSFVSNSTTSITNRRHTICAVKDTYARPTFLCHTPISSNKQLGRRILETITESEYMDTSPTSTINDLDTSEVSIKTCHTHEEEEEKISSPIDCSDDSIEDDIDAISLTSTDSTPKCMLRKNLAALTQEYEDLQQYTSLESMFSKYPDILGLLRKMERIEFELINLRERETRQTSLKCQKCHQLQNNDKSKPDTELNDLNELCNMFLINKNELLKETCDKFKVPQIKLNSMNKQMNKLVKLEENDKPINDVLYINGASKENEKCIEKLNEINLILNQRQQDVNETHYIYQQLLKLKEILEKPSIVDTREIQTDISQINHIVPQQQREEIAHESVCTQTEINFENAQTTRCHDEIDLLQIIYTSVSEQLQISTDEVDTQTDSYVPRDFVQVNHMAVQTEYEGINTQPDSKNQVENNTQTEEIALTSVCIQTDNVVEEPPTVVCIQVQTDLLPTEHTAVQTQYRGISSNTQTENKIQTEKTALTSVCIQTDSVVEEPPTVVCIQVQTDLLPTEHVAIQTQYQGISAITQTEESALTSVCIQTDNVVEESPTVVCIQVQTDLLPTEHAAIQTQYQGISANTQTEESALTSVCIQTDNVVEESPTVVCIQVQTDLLPTEHVAIQTQYQGISANTQTENKIRIESKTQTEESALTSVCIQTDNVVEESPTVVCIQVQTDLLPTVHAAIQTQYQGISANTQTEESALTSVCIQTDNVVEESPTVVCIQVQTDLLQTEHAAIQTQYQGISANTQTEESALTSVCIQTDNVVEESPTVVCIQVQTDLLPTEHVAIQTQYQGISANTQTENKIRIESKTQTEESALTSVCIQTDNVVEESPTVVCIQVQTDLLPTEHVAVQTQYQGISINNISTQTIIARNSICIQTEDLEKPPAVHCIHVQTDLLSVNDAVIQTQYQEAPTNNINTQTERITQKESKTQTVETTYNSACTQTENGVGLPSTVQFTGVQTDLLTNHIASASRISTCAVHTESKSNLSQEATCTRTTNDLGNLSVNSTKSPREKRKQKIHDIYDSNRRISSELSKEDIDIIEEDLSRYQKEKEEEVSKLNKELTDLKEENAILNNEVEFFMDENKELKKELGELKLEKEEEVSKLNKKLTDLKEDNVILNDEVEFFMDENKELKKELGELKFGKPLEQNQHCTECNLFRKQLQTLEADVTEKLQQISALEKMISELLDTERKNKQQLAALKEENEGLKRTKELLKIKYNEVKKLYLDEIGR